DPPAEMLFYQCRNVVAFAMVNGQLRAQLPSPLQLGGVAGCHGDIATQVAGDLQRLDGDATADPPDQDTLATDQPGAGVQHSPGGQGGEAEGGGFWPFPFTADRRQVALGHYQLLGRTSAAMFTEE